MDLLSRIRLAIAKKNKLTLEQQENYELVKQFVKQLAKHTTEQTGDKVTFRLKKAKHSLSKYVYIEVVNKEEQGEITVGLIHNPHSKKLVPKIVHSFMYQHVVRSALADLHVLKKIKMTKAENRWKGAKS